MRTMRLVIIMVVFAALVHWVPFLEGFESFVTRPVVAVARLAHSAVGAIGAIPAGWGNAAALTRERDALKDEVIHLKDTVASLTGIAQENDALRVLAGIEKRSDITIIPANVVGSDPDVSVHTLVIDKGSNHGVRRGDAIVFGRSTLVGKAERVTANRTTVLLAVDPKSAVAAMDAEHPEANGVAKGERGLVVKLSLIPQNAPMEEGDQVVTTGLEPTVPRGLLVGTIDSISKNPSDPFASAIVIPSIDPLRLTVVSVFHVNQ